MKPPPSPPCRSAILRMRNIQMPKNTSAGTHPGQDVAQERALDDAAELDVVLGELIRELRFDARRDELFLAVRSGSVNVPWITLSRTVISLTLPPSSSFRTRCTRSARLPASDPGITQPDHGEQRKQEIPQLIWVVRSKRFRACWLGGRPIDIGTPRGNFAKRDGCGAPNFSSRRVPCDCLPGRRSPLVYAFF